MAVTGIQASGYPFADIPVCGGLFFKYGSLFIHIIEGGDRRGIQNVRIFFCGGLRRQQILNFMPQFTYCCCFFDFGNHFFE